MSRRLGSQKASCFDCGRAEVPLTLDGLFSRHKAAQDSTTWPNPNAAYPNGWCKGSGRWIGELTEREGCW